MKKISATALIQLRSRLKDALNQSHVAQLQKSRSRDSVRPAYDDEMAEAAGV